MRNLFTNISLIIYLLVFSNLGWCLSPKSFFKGQWAWVNEIQVDFNKRVDRTFASASPSDFYFRLGEEMRQNGENNPAFSYALSSRNKDYGIASTCGLVSFGKEGITGGALLFSPLPKTDPRSHTHLWKHIEYSPILKDGARSELENLLDALSISYQKNAGGNIYYLSSDGLLRWKDYYKALDKYILHLHDYTLQKITSQDFEGIYENLLLFFAGSEISKEQQILILISSILDYCRDNLITNDLQVLADDIKLARKQLKPVVPGFILGSYHEALISGMMDFLRIHYYKGAIPDSPMGIFLNLPPRLLIKHSAFFNDWVHKNKTFFSWEYGSPFLGICAWEECFIYDSLYEGRFGSAPTEGFFRDQFLSMLQVSKNKRDEDRVKYAVDVFRFWMDDFFQYFWMQYNEVAQSRLAIRFKLLKNLKKRVDFFDETALNSLKNSLFIPVGIKAIDDQLEQLVEASLTNFREKIKVMRMFLSLMEKYEKLPDAFDFYTFSNEDQLIFNAEQLLLTPFANEFQFWRLNAQSRDLLVENMEGFTRVFFRKPKEKIARREPLLSPYLAMTYAHVHVLENNMKSAKIWYDFAFNLVPGAVKERESKMKEHLVQGSPYSLFSPYAPSVILQEVNRMSSFLQICPLTEKTGFHKDHLNKDGKSYPYDKQILFDLLREGLFALNKKEDAFNRSLSIAKFIMNLDFEHSIQIDDMGQISQMFLNSDIPEEMLLYFFHALISEDNPKRLIFFQVFKGLLDHNEQWKNHFPSIDAFIRQQFKTSSLSTISLETLGLYARFMLLKRDYSTVLRLTDIMRVRICQKKNMDVKAIPEEFGKEGIFFYLGPVIRRQKALFLHLETKARNLASQWIASAKLEGEHRMPEFGAVLKDLEDKLSIPDGPWDQEIKPEEKRFESEAEKIAQIDFCISSDSVEKHFWETVRKELDIMLSNYASNRTSYQNLFLVEPQLILDVKCVRKCLETIFSSNDYKHNVELKPGFEELQNRTVFYENLLSFLTAVQSKYVFEANALLRKMEDNPEIAAFLRTHARTTKSARKSKKKSKGANDGKNNFSVNSFSDLSRKMKNELNNATTLQSVLREIFSDLYHHLNEIPGQRDVGSLSVLRSGILGVLARQPDILCLNPFETKKDPLLWSFAERYLLNHPKDEIRIINDIDKRIAEILEKKNGFYQEFISLFAREDVSRSDLEVWIKKVQELFDLDREVFVQLFEDVTNLLNNDFLKLLAMESGNRNPWRAFFNTDHQSIPPFLFYKVQQASFISSELAKFLLPVSLEMTDKDLVQQLETQIEKLALIASETHQLQMIHYLKAERLKLEVLIWMDEKKTETITNSQWKKYNTRFTKYQSLEVFSSKGLVKLSLRNLEDLDAGIRASRPHKLIDHVSRIFEPGMLVSFFNDPDKFERANREGTVVPTFEVLGVERGADDPGSIVFKWVNAQLFPDKTLKQMFHQGDFFLNKKEGFITIPSLAIQKRQLDLLNRIINHLIPQFKTWRQQKIEKGFADQPMRIFFDDRIHSPLDRLLGFQPIQEKIKLERMLLNFKSSLDSRGFDLNEGQKKVVKALLDSLSGDLSDAGVILVEAPGGSGKTHTQAVSNLLLYLKGKKSIALTAPTHSAVDTSIEKLESLKERNLESLPELKSLQIARLAHQDRIELIRDHILKNYWENRQESIAEGIHGYTSTGGFSDPVANKLQMQRFSSKGVLERDVIHCDEASMLSLSELMTLVYLRLSERGTVLLWGDHLQLPTWGFSVEEQKKVEQFLGYEGMDPVNWRHNIFRVNLEKTLFSGFYRHSLSTSVLKMIYGCFGYPSFHLPANFRYTPLLTELLNRMGYAEAGVSLFSKKADLNIPLEKQVVFLDNTQWRKIDETLPNMKKRGAYINRDEIRSILKQMDMDLRDEYINRERKLDGSQMIFVSPYRSQIKTFNASLKALAVLGELFGFLKGDSLIRLSEEEMVILKEEIEWLMQTFTGNCPQLNWKVFILEKESSIESINAFIDNLQKSLPDFIPLDICAQPDGPAITLKRIIGIKTEDMEEDLNGMEVTTVQKVQGQENRVIYISYVRNNRMGKLGFLFGEKGQSMQITATGRASELVRVAASRDTWQVANSHAYPNSSAKKSVKMMLEYIRFARELKDTIHHINNEVGRPGELSEFDIAA